MIPVLSAARQRFAFKPRTGIKRCSGPLRVPMRNGDGKGLLTTAGRAAGRHSDIGAVCPDPFAEPGHRFLYRDLARTACTEARDQVTLLIRV